MVSECELWEECICIKANNTFPLRSADAIVEQIPVLGELRRAMEELALIDPPPPQRSLIIEQVNFSSELPKG